jgi:ABC-type polysaccharide/polyol phosphate export permease
LGTLISSCSAPLLSGVICPAFVILLAGVTRNAPEKDLLAQFPGATTANLTEEGTGMSDYLASIWKSRNFWLFLVLNDLQLRYRRSVLGIGWSLLHPIATALVLGAVFHEIFHADIRDFLPYLLCGLAFWAYLTGAVVGGCQCYVQAESYIRQHPLPLLVYPLRSTLGGMIHFLIALALVVLLTLVLRGPDKRPEWISLLVGLVMLFLFGLAVTALVGFLNVAFRDTQHLLEIGFQILFYLTPIMYPAGMLASRRLGMVLSYNPIVPFLELIRKPILDGEPAPLACYVAVLMLTLFVGGVAVLTLNWQQRRVVHYL